MKIKVFQNWGLKLLSLILAFVIWFLVVQINDPQDTSSFSNIQVQITNTELLENANKVYEILDNTDKVRVTVRAPRSILQEIRSGDIVAEADMSKLTDINTIMITYDIENVDMASVEITGNHDDIVRLNVEEKKRKYIQVDYNVIGEVADGYLLGTISLEQNRIEISGPQSAVDQVKNASVEIDISNATSSLSADLELYLYNSDGEEIVLNNLNKQMDYVHVSAEILPTKEIPITVSYQGEPKEGYIVSGEPVIEPETVLVAGSSRVLNNTKSIVIPASAVDISEAEENVSLELNIGDYLPNTLRIADSSYNGKVRIEIPVQRIIKMTLRVPAGNISFRNLPDGLEILETESDSVVEVEISGLRDLISALRTTTIYGTVDTAEWMKEQGLETLLPGEYTMPVAFVFDEYVTLENEPEIHVAISEAEE